MVLMSIKYWSPKKYHVEKIIHLFVKVSQMTSSINKFKDKKTKITTTTTTMSLILKYK